MYHTPVLLKEAIKYLKPEKNQNFIDCTLGGAGHTQAILEKTGPQGKLLGIDADRQAIKQAQRKLADFAERAILVQDNFRNLQQIVKVHNFKPIHGILLDLGISSHQIDQDKKGFSFMKDQNLDMRFDSRGKLTAYNIINTWSENKLKDLFYNFAELKNAESIAKNIIAMRKKGPIRTASMLVGILIGLRRFSPANLQGKTYEVSMLARIFQALRIAVNDELNALKEVLPQAVKVLAPQGRLAVICFHSLEDRIVKQFFKEQSSSCLCPFEIPVCRCDHSPQIKILFKKVVKPQEAEIKSNPRSRSARLRVCHKLNAN